MSVVHLSLQLAYQYQLNGQLKESLQTYRKAFNQDETSVSALAGIIYCQITSGQLAEAEQQLEFLNEVRICRSGVNMPTMHLSSYTV